MSVDDVVLKEIVQLRDPYIVHRKFTIRSKTELSPSETCDVLGFEVNLAQRGGA
jgi:hypothetical protein